MLTWRNGAVCGTLIVRAQKGRPAPRSSAKFSGNALDTDGALRYYSRVGSRSAHENAIVRCAWTYEKPRVRSLKTEQCSSK